MTNIVRWYLAICSIHPAANRVVSPSGTNVAWDCSLNHEVHTVCLDRCKIPMKDVTGTSSGGVRSIHSSLSRCSYCLTLLSHTFLLELSQKTVTLHMQQLLGVGIRGLLCNPRVPLTPLPSVSIQFVLDKLYVYSQNKSVSFSPSGDDITE